MIFVQSKAPRCVIRRAVIDTLNKHHAQRKFLLLSLPSALYVRQIYSSMTIDDLRDTLDEIQHAPSIPRSLQLSYTVFCCSNEFYDRNEAVLSDEKKIPVLIKSLIP